MQEDVKRKVKVVMYVKDGTGGAPVITVFIVSGLGRFLLYFVSLLGNLLVWTLEDHRGHGQSNRSIVSSPLTLLFQFWWGEREMQRTYHYM